MSTSAELGETVASRPENGPDGSSASPAQGMNQLGRRIQELVEQIEALKNPAARGLVQECLESLLSFYGQGLARILEIAERTGGENVLDALARDHVVSGLLLIHDLHPASLESRLHQALEKVRPYMESHGGNVELVNLENDFATLRLQGHCQTCASSAVTLELAVRNAIEEICPDLLGFEVEGAQAANPAAPAPPRGEPSWTLIDDAALLHDGELIRITAAEIPLIICKARDRFYAYRDRCPGCNLPLHLGVLNEQVLTCRAGHRFDVQRAGAGLDHPDLHLDPVPLLLEEGAVKVAVERESSMA